jgi:hypothetical protein
MERTSIATSSKKLYDEKVTVELYNIEAIMSYYKTAIKRFINSSRQ